MPLKFGPISQAEFITIIDNLDAKSSNNIDGISNKTLKFLKYELATPLVHLFNLSIQTGEFPNNLKMSRTVPIFKSGDPMLCDNYRPISLLSSISKVLEKSYCDPLDQSFKNKQSAERKPVWVPGKILNHTPSP
jgi:Notch-like protein